MRPSGWGSPRTTRSNRLATWACRAIDRDHLPCESRELLCPRPPERRVRRVLVDPTPSPMTRSTPSCATRNRRQRLRGVLDRIAVARADAASGAAPPLGRTARCARVGIRRIRPLLPRGDAGRPAFGAQRVPGSPVTGAYGDVPAVALWVSQHFLTRDTDLTPARLDAISSSHKESPREVHLTVCRCGTTPGGPRRHLRRGKADGVQTGSGRGCRIRSPPVPRQAGARFASQSPCGAASRSPAA